MSSFNMIFQWEGVVVDVRPRYWQAHQQAVAAVALTGPPENEYWRLFRSGASDRQLVPHAKPLRLEEYNQRRQELLASASLLALDKPQPGAAQSLGQLKRMGSCRLATLEGDRRELETAVGRLQLGDCFDRTEVLPEDRNQREALLRKLAEGSRTTLAVAGTIPFAYAADQAGCCVVGFKSGLTYPKFMHQVGVDLIFGSWEELTDALGQHDPQLRDRALP